MGSAGVKLAISKANMRKALVGHRGCVSKAARGLKIAPSTLQKRIDADPELKRMVHELRHEYDEMVFDEVEDTLLFAITNRKKDLTTAARVAMWYANIKGKSRGFHRVDITHIATEEDHSRHNALMSQLRELQSARNIANSNISEETKS